MTNNATNTIGMTGTMIVAPAGAPSLGDPMQHEVRQSFAVHAIIGENIVLLMDSGADKLTPKIIAVADLRDGETGPGWRKSYHLDPVEKLDVGSVVRATLATIPAPVV